MQKYNTIYGIVIALICVMSSCMKSEEETVVLPNQISSNVIPEQVRSTLQNYIPIYEGDNPPIISGCYVASQMVLKYSSDSLDIAKPGLVVCEMFYQYGPQRVGHISQYKERQNDIERTSNDMTVVGSGQNFSAYYIADGYHDYDDDGYNESYSKFSVIVSGTMSEHGIRNFHYAFISLDKIDPLEQMADVNTFRVYVDADSLAETYPIWQVPMRRTVE